MTVSRRGKIGLATVPALRPGEVLWDIELKRFGARCRTSGVTFFVKAQINRRQTWLTIGRLGPLTPAEARAKARQVLAEIDSGRDPRRERYASRNMPTLGAFAERWLAVHVALKRKPATLEHYRRLLVLHVMPTMEAVRLDQVSPADVLTLQANLAGHRYAANRMLAVLSALFNYAERLGLRPPSSNPCRGIERYREAKRKRPLTKAEVERLWTHLTEATPTEGPYVVAAIRLLLLTGMRKSEVLTLRWSHVDLDASTIALFDSKTGAREVFLSNVAVAVLKGIPRQHENPFVICGERDGQPRVNLAKPWHRLRTRLGFPDVRIHDLRHTTASMLARRAPLVVVRDALGHRLIGTTSGYSHAANDDMRTAMNVLAADITGETRPA